MRKPLHPDLEITTPVFLATLHVFLGSSYYEAAAAESGFGVETVTWLDGLRLGAARERSLKLQPGNILYSLLVMIALVKRFFANQERWPPCGGASRKYYRDGISRAQCH